MNSALDNLPIEVQQAIYNVFSECSIGTQIIFLSRLQYGNELTYGEIGNAVGVSLQRTQKVVDLLFNEVRQEANLIMLSGVASGVLCV